MIKRACHIDNLMEEVLAFAKPLKKDRSLIHQMKLDTHKETIAIIDERVEALRREIG